jgi:hypothetical protein
MVALSCFFLFAICKLCTGMRESWERSSTLTQLPEPLLKPIEPCNHDDYADKAHIGDDWNNIYHDLLVELQVFHIVPAELVRAIRRCRSTHVLSPDSVEPLAAKNIASTAFKLP